VSERFNQPPQVTSIAGRTDAGALVVIEAADGTERPSSWLDPRVR
jgi:hypothetical protein